MKEGDSSPSNSFYTDRNPLILQEFFFLTCKDIPFHSLPFSAPKIKPFKHKLGHKRQTQQQPEERVDIHNAPTRHKATADGLQLVLTGREKGAKAGDVAGASALKGGCCPT